ncbi:MAG: hypothetical protein FWF81_14150 [Defluviitaleaceae bacterium]|nr:hypothetical protein [Defluviitaleaceae bacterium]
MQKSNFLDLKLVDTLYYLSALVMPSVFLFDLYNRNFAENHINYGNTLVFAGLFSVFGLFMLLSIKFVLKSVEGALVFSLIFWLIFWFFEALFSAAEVVFKTPLVFLIFLGIVLFCFLFFLKTFKPPYYKIRSAFNILAICLIVIFLFNFIPGVRREITIHRARASIIEGEEPFYIKRDFIINNELPSPDIYWFHVDGMMSLETMENFWGISMEYLRGEFTRRGFVIYENAFLNAGFTDSALPALLSPSFYDSFWRERLIKFETELRTNRVIGLNNELALVGLTYSEDIVPYYELFRAFVARDYDIEIICWDYTRSVILPLSFEPLYLSRWERLFIGDLPELISITTPFNIVPSHERITASNYNTENDNGESARFVWKTLKYAHMNYIWEYVSDLTEWDRAAIHLYPAGVEHLAQRVFYFIDSILADNPNAVIVLQSDHGFHIRETQQHLLEQGYSLEEILELKHSVFSAIRIPEHYGGVKAPIAPKNITRELVNRFVGENYILLP